MRALVAAGVGLAVLSSCLLDTVGRFAGEPGAGGEAGNAGGSATGGDASGPGAGGAEAGGAASVGGNAAGGAMGGGGSAGSGVAGGGGAPPIDCGAGIKDPTTDHCYVAFDTPSTTAVARSACQGLGPRWDLAAISTPAELDVVLPLFNQGRLVGATDAGDEDNWQWLNGEPWSYALGGPFWHANEPNGGSGENCGEIWGSPPLFNDIGCTDERGYLCEQTNP